MLKVSPQRQRDRPDHHRRQELDRRQQDVERLRDARREEDALEVGASTVLADALDVEHEPRHDREEQRHGDLGGGREGDAREDLHEVEEEDHQKGRQQVRDVAHAVVADDLLGDVVAHEADDRLADHLRAARDDLGLAEADEHRQAGQRERDGHRQHDPGDAERVVVERLEVEQVVEARHLGGEGAHDVRPSRIGPTKLGPRIHVQACA
jgi:hypothetical protein